MSICLDCKTSSRQVCPVHAATDNHSDSVDLEIARLKAELAEAKLYRDCIQRENEEWRKASKDWADLHDVEKREAELSRLTEENRRLVDLLRRADKLLMRCSYDHGYSERLALLGEDMGRALYPYATGDSE
jgi:hypothetical protein